MNRLKELRKEKKLTQKELAEKTDIPYRTLQRWENGETDIKSDAATKLADFFGVHEPYLLGYSPIRTMEEEISTMVDDFNKDFINFLKYHDLYLSDTQINLVTQIMYSMSNINDKYLMTFMGNEDFKGLETAKTFDFNKLFEYSSFWDMQYNGLKTISKLPERKSKTYDISELRDILRNSDSE